MWGSFVLWVKMADLSRKSLSRILYPKGSTRTCRTQHVCCRFKSQTIYYSQEIVKCVQDSVIHLLKGAGRKDEGDIVIYVWNIFFFVCGGKTFLESGKLYYL